MEIIHRNEECENTKDIDINIKNKFRWSWLETKDENGDFLSEFIRKVNQPGIAICTWCGDKPINYGGSGSVIVSFSLI